MYGGNLGRGKFPYMRYAGADGSAVFEGRTFNAGDGGCYAAGNHRAEIRVPRGAQSACDARGPRRGVSRAQEQPRAGDHGCALQVAIDADARERGGILILATVVRIGATAATVGATC